MYAPCAQGQAVALRRCYEAASYSPETVELIEAHGTQKVLQPQPVSSRL
ncbi:MAG: hypothetical protein B5M56_10710 [Desulfococcus sp. 4484_241]|nr:MAG: hypothetical protein B5M56_10710 [Desulfococcus sp. 4484_241]